MKKGEKTEYSLFSRGGLLILIIILIIIAIAAYFLFFSYAKCSDENCFFSSMESCKKVSWIKEDSQAAWSYRILGSSNNKCNVEVKLIKLKQGNIDIEKLEGKRMVCSVDKGTIALPEKTLSKCTGVLKEQMQEIIIQRMHNYLLKNVGQLEEGFEEI